MNPGLAQLTTRALCEMVNHDLTIRVFGFNHVRNKLAKQPMPRRQEHPGLTARICEAVNLAACFYFKPVRCLQKSVVTARLLRKCGIDGRVVIGYRQAPFFSHAWVEVVGRVVNDSPAYKEQLLVLSVL
jgi:hypothetical protein